MCLTGLEVGHIRAVPKGPSPSEATASLPLPPPTKQIDGPPSRYLTQPHRTGLTWKHPVFQRIKILACIWEVTKSNTAVRNIASRLDPRLAAYQWRIRGSQANLSSQSVEQVRGRGDGGGGRDLVLPVFKCNAPKRIFTCDKKYLLYKKTCVLY